MTDRQLAIVLRGIRDRLAREIADVQDDLLPLLPPETERRHTSSHLNLFGCTDETHYEDVPTGEVRVLANLRAMVDDLTAQIDLLEAAPVPDGV